MDALQFRQEVLQWISRAEQELTEKLESVSSISLCLLDDYGKSTESKDSKLNKLFLLNEYAKSKELKDSKHNEQYLLDESPNVANV